MVDTSTDSVVSLDAPKQTVFTSRLLVATAYLLCSLLLLLRESRLLGPCIFVDETLYYQLARSIWEEFSYVGHTAYNPLYSLLIAPLFALHSQTAIYAAIRHLNCFLWASSLFPVFWLARRSLQGFWMPLALAVATVFMPLGANVPLVRSEPLFFPLFCLNVWLGLRMLEEDDPQLGVKAGLAAGLLFLTKQAGLVLVLALGVTWLLYWLQEGRPASRLRTAAAYICGFLVLAAPWMIRNHRLGSSAVGYNEWVEKMFQGAASVRLIQSFGLNLTYVFLALGGGLFVLYIFSLVQLPKLSREDKLLGYFSLAILLSELSICALIGLVIPENQGRIPFMPTGRYIDNAFPVICVFLLRVAGGQRNILLKRLPQTALIWAVGCAAIYYYSPLQAVVAKSSGDNPSLSFLVPIFASSGGKWWDLPRIVTPIQSWALVLGMWALIVPFLLLGRRNTLALFLCGGSIVSGIFASRNLHNVLTAMRPENEASIWLMQHHVPANQMAFDSDLQPEISTFAFWFRGRMFGPPLQTMTTTEARLPLRLEFGPANSPPAPGSVRIQPPWSAAAALFDPEKGYGFRSSDLPNLRSDARCGGSAQDNSNTCVFAEREGLFRVQVPPIGRYLVTIKTAPREAQSTLPTNFRIVIGAREWNVNRDHPVVRSEPASDPVIEFPGELDIGFRPASQSVWLLKSMEIVKAYPKEPPTERYFVSIADLPLKADYSSDGIHVYELHPQPPASAPSAADETIEIVVDTTPAATQDTPLGGFAQGLRSSVTELSLHKGEIAQVPVSITNPGSELWGVGGKYPILLSYRWFRNGQMLPVEGRRTPRSTALLPGQSEEVMAGIEAPNEPGKYTLRLTLVQEGVAWFFASGGEGLDIPTSVQ